MGRERSVIREECQIGARRASPRTLLSCGHIEVAASKLFIGFGLIRNTCGEVGGGEAARLTCDCFVFDYCIFYWTFLFFCGFFGLFGLFLLFIHLIVEGSDPPPSRLSVLDRWRPPKSHMEGHK